MPRHASVPHVVAHRGYQRAYPENTVASIEAAIACGARFVEVDVHLTLDRVPVLLHDEVLDRICGVPGRVDATPWDALSKLSAHEPGRLGDRFLGHPVASLEACRAVMEAHPGVGFFVELKEAAARAFGAGEVVARVVEVMAPVLDRCVMISFGEDLLREAQAAGCAVGAVVRSWEARGIVERFERRPVILFCDIRGLPAAGGLQLDGVDVAIYETPDATTAMALHARGVTHVETFGICEMLRDLQVLESGEAGSGDEPGH